MDVITAMVTIASIALAHTCALLSVWLRLRWRVRHADVQGRHLTRLAETAAGHG
ncbi:hypothetical protein [Spongiactinospora sp. 9N601]|uniref:hypothetical protein n=1 Tax=Spongiactinospora sp. 9N601 TaxID=3375149 RepID=UPI00378CBD0A